MSSISAFNNIEIKHSLYCGKGFMKKFCTSLGDHATNVTNFGKNKMLPLTKKELRLHQERAEC